MSCHTHVKGTINVLDHQHLIYSRITQPIFPGIKSIFDDYVPQVLYPMATFGANAGGNVPVLGRMVDEHVVHLAFMQETSLCPITVLQTIFTVSLPEL